MTTARRWRMASVAGLGMGLAGLTGCQTWVGGMTLPSPHYLEHPPQYFPPDPDFPLQRELNTQLAQDAAARAACAPPVVGVPGPVIVPPPAPTAPPPAPVVPANPPAPGR